MRIFVSGATTTVDAMAATECGKHHLGRLYSPRGGHVFRDDIPWGVDNDCFTKYDPEAFQRMLDRLETCSMDRAKFVAVPDVVGDWEATLGRYDEWFNRMLHCPHAIVCQDGATVENVPFCTSSAVFIGGTDDFKKSPEAFAIATEARRRRKWIHVGRVNSYQRARNWIGLADSIDGSQFSWFSETYIPDWMQWIAGQLKQDRLFSH